MGTDERKNGEMALQRQTADRLVYREEMQSGLADMMIASFFIVPAVVISRPGLTWLYLVPLLLLGPAYRAARRTYIEPRLGYAELQTEPPGRLLGGIAIFGIVAAALLGLVLLALGDAGEPSQWRRWAPALAGVLFGGGLVYAGRRSGLPRYFLLALLSAGGGTLLALFIHSGSYLGLRIYLLVMGILVFGNGLILFSRFTRTHPIHEEETHGQE
jgi:hypothetical protein